MKRYKTSEYATRWSSLIYGGLVAISVIIIQDYISTGLTDPASYVAVIAFAVAIPMLVTKIVSSFIENMVGFYAFRASRGGPGLLKPQRGGISVIFVLGIISTMVGLGATFWHISWIVGLVFIVSVVISYFFFGLYIAQAGFTDFFQKQAREEIPAPEPHQHA